MKIHPGYLQYIQGRRNDFESGGYKFASGASGKIFLGPPTFGLLHLHRKGCRYNQPLLLLAPVSPT